MKHYYNMHEAKTQLSQLVARVEKGEEIVIARKGVPVAHLVPAPIEPRKFQYGQHGDLVSPEWLERWDELEVEFRKLFADYAGEEE